MVRQKVEGPEQFGFCGFSEIFKATWLKWNDQQDLRVSFNTGVIKDGWKNSGKSLNIDLQMGKSLKMSDSPATELMARWYHPCTMNH